MDIATIDNALAFLSRVQLTGAEVPAFVQVNNALHEERIRLVEASKEPPK